MTTRDFVAATRFDARQKLSRVNTNPRGTSREQRGGISCERRSKTSLVDAGRETFDFLGYTFGPAHSRRTGRLYQSVRPSAKSVGRIKQKVRAVLRPGNMQPWPEVVARLNPMQRGWASYFRRGARAVAWRAVQNHVLERVRHFLRRRHKVTTHGDRQFSADRIFGELGVQKLTTLKGQLSFVCRR